MHRSVIATALLAGLLWHGTAVLPAVAGDELIDYTLANGLRVVLVPDHRVPKVSLTVTYRVGSANEPPGRSGFAHLFEHLMFSGTPAHPRIDEALSALGVDNNAFTHADETIYFEVGLASTLPVLLSIEADRMANLGNAVDQGELDIQREVVLSEMAQNVLDAPAGAASEALDAGLFPAGHPYNHAVIGSIPDVRAADLADVKAFFDIYYVPNNAVVAIVGDFDIATVKDEVARTFGLVPEGRPVPAPEPASFPPTRWRLETADRVPAPVLFMGFTGPPSAAPESGALAIAAELLGNSEYGVLRSRLVDTGLATYAFARWRPGALGGRFIVGGSAAPPTSGEAFEAALRGVLADFGVAPLDAADVERARANLLLQQRVGIEPFANRAYAVGIQASQIGDLSDALTDDKDIASATVDDVEAAVRRLLDLDAASVALVRPGAGGDYPAVLKDSTGVATPLLAEARPQVDIPTLPAGTPGVASLPEPQYATLSNGITIVHYQLADVPMLYLAASVRGGGRNDPPGKEGLIDLAARMSSRGAGARDLTAFSKAAKDIGADISALTGQERTAVLLAVPPASFEEGLALLADAVQRPRFDEPAWDVLMRQAIQRQIQASTNLDQIAVRALNDQIFIPGPGEPAAHRTLESVRSIALDEARAIYRDLFVPSTMTFYSVGDLPLERMLPALEHEFGGWQAPGAGLPSRPLLGPTFPDRRRVLVVPGPRGAQTSVFVARPAPGWSDPDQPATLVVSRLLGGEFLSRLNGVMREQKGYSYGVDAGTWNSIPGTTAMFVSASVASAATGMAVSDIVAGFASLGGTPVSADELNRSVTAHLSGLASQAETAESLMSLLASSSANGLTLDDLQRLATDVTKLKLGGVQRVATELASLDRAVVVVAGDPADIVRQLAAVGITDAQVLPEQPAP